MSTACRVQDCDVAALERIHQSLLALAVEVQALRSRMAGDGPTCERNPRQEEGTAP